MDQGRQTGGVAEALEANKSVRKMPAPETCLEKSIETAADAVSEEIYYQSEQV
jgi:hypothetical protein